MEREMGPERAVESRSTAVVVVERGRGASDSQRRRLGRPVDAFGVLVVANGLAFDVDFDVGFVAGNVVGIVFVVRSGRRDGQQSTAT
jgi:hypothetical protein